MNILNHLFAALGRVLLWVSSVLVLEELTLGGLARLLLSRRFDRRERRGRRRRRTRGGKTRGGAAVGLAAGPPRRSLEVDSKAVQGGVSCSQSNTF